MKKGLFFLSLILLLVIFLGSLNSQVFAEPSCCTSPDNGGQSCFDVPGPNRPPFPTCAAGVKTCDTNYNVRCGPGLGTGTGPDLTRAANGCRDLNGNGIWDNYDNYNPTCFVAVAAPAQVKITDFGKLFSGAVGLLLLIAFILAFLYLILGGIGWITSGGDKAAVENARGKIIAAIIGLLIVASVWALFQLIGGAIGFNILKGFSIPRLF